MESDWWQVEQLGLANQREALPSHSPSEQCEERKKKKKDFCLLGNLIVLILAGNLKLLYSIYKTLAFPREGVLWRLWNNILQHILPKSSAGLAPLPALPQGSVNPRSPSGAWLPISEKFPLHPPRAPISTCLRKEPASHLVKPLVPVGLFLPWWQESAHVGLPWWSKTPSSQCRGSWHDPCSGN